MLTRCHTLSSIAFANTVKELYLDGQTDYGIEPLVLTDENHAPVGRIQDGDAVIFCCRRGEREIQLTEAFVAPVFDAFPRCDFQQLNFVILTLYHDKFKNIPVAFAPSPIRDTLGEVVSRALLRQLRISESEKFAHVTFFLNGGNNQAFPGEDDWCVPSPKGISYEQMPELSLPQVTEKLLQSLQEKYDLIITNFANGDVIGHTTSTQAKIECAQVVDQCLGQVIAAATAAGYVVLVTADHGNLEEMVTLDGTPHVSHTTNLVPFILTDPLTPSAIKLREGGVLADVAPTILDALSIAQPEAMNGATLAPHHNWNGVRRVLLVILDGWGIGKNDQSNPIFLTNTPVWDSLLQRYPNTQLQASGEAVGLQPGKAGNSEAGHMNIGAGRIILQDDVRLDQAMRDGSFYTNDILYNTIREVKQRGRNLHLICLLSEKSSHGSIEYPLALLRIAKDGSLQQVYLHVIFDGRSTEPGSAPELLEKLDRQIAEIGIGKIVTGMGRSIALDRDRNYAKTQRAYNALVYGIGRSVQLLQR
jgi:2,3-bisphosphoglycerate-independent phosphoglycerate mutase